MPKSFVLPAYLFDLVADSDGDGVVDDVDNCVDDPNVDQVDFDGDLMGDACDAATDMFDVKQDVASDLAAMQSGALDKDANRIDKAIEEITKSLREPLTKRAASPRSVGPRFESY